MTRYLDSTSHTTIHVKMLEKFYYWSTFVSFLELIYFPEAHSLSQGSDNIAVHKELNILCVRTGLMCMQYVCLAENAASVVKHEGLMDFITCAPWLMPSHDLQSSARDLVALAQDKIALQPPSLTGLIKAQLAAHRFGLQRVLLNDAYTLILYVLAGRAH